MSRKHRHILIGALLGIAILAAFGRLWTHDYVSFDDPDYVLENPMVRAGLTARGIAWAFTTTHASNWFPLTWLSHMADVELFGLNAGAHHGVNLILHLVNALLLLFVLNRMSGEFWRSVLVAALFALHPLHVESVAWVSERKDVLSTAFLMMTIWAYVRYAEKPVTRRYLAVFVLFAAGLMAKPMLVTLPFVLLLLDYWPLQRMTTGRSALVKGRAPARVVQRTVADLVFEKLPLMALSAASSIVTFLIQRSWGAVSPLDELPLGLRIGNALVSYVAYVRKTVWPKDLSVFYPFEAQLPFSAIAGAGLLLAAVSLIILLNARRFPFLPTGWFWYLGTLVPVIGFVQVGSQSMADRYTYIPLIGLFILFGWSIPDCTAFPRAKKLLFCAPPAAVLLAFGVCTWFQVGHWRSSDALFRHALRADPNNYLAHASLGVVLADEGNFKEAIASYEESLRLKPLNSTAITNMALAMAGMGRLEEAIACYRQALEINPNKEAALNNLAWVLATAQRQELRNGAEALKLAKRACDLTDNPHPTLLDTLAAAYAEAGRYDDAVSEAAKAVRLAISSGREDLAAAFRARMDLYLAGTPYREIQAAVER